MRILKISGALTCVAALLVGSVMAGEKTCCQKAHDQGRDCAHKCCIAAHKEAKSCQKCNPNKEDLKFIKKKPEQKSGKKAE
jgi:hypothetical protein